MAENNVIQTTQQGVSRNENQRYGVFVGIQIFFLVVSLFTGGFNFTVWSMLDSSILIVSIGITGLLFIIDDTKLRKVIFNVSIVLYILAVLDMAVNVLISGSLGWGRL
jgi:hypothetical protein